MLLKLLTTAFNNLMGRPTVLPMARSRPVASYFTKKQGTRGYPAYRADHGGELPPPSKRRLKKLVDREVERLQREDIARKGIHPKYLHSHARASWTGAR